jgi:hypothetical protein
VAAAITYKRASCGRTSNCTNNTTYADLHPIHCLYFNITDTINMLRTQVIKLSRATPSVQRSFSAAAIRAAEGDTGATRSGGIAGGYECILDSE